MTLVTVVKQHLPDSQKSRMRGAANILQNAAFSNAVSTFKISKTSGLRSN